MAVQIRCKIYRFEVWSMLRFLCYRLSLSLPVCLWDIWLQASLGFHQYHSKGGSPTAEKSSLHSLIPGQLKLTPINSQSSYRAFWAIDLALPRVGEPERWGVRCTEGAHGGIVSVFECYLGTFSCCASSLQNCPNELSRISGCSKPILHGRTRYPSPPWPNCTHSVAGTGIYLGTKLRGLNLPVKLESAPKHGFVFLCVSAVWRLLVARSPWASEAHGSHSVQASPCVAHMFPSALWIGLCAEQHPSEQLLHIPLLQTLTLFTFPPGWKWVHVKWVRARLQASPVTPAVPLAHPSSVGWVDLQSHRRVGKQGRLLLRVTAAETGDETFPCTSSHK